MMFLSNSHIQEAPRESSWQWNKPQVPQVLSYMRGISNMGQFFWNTLYEDISEIILLPSPNLPPGNLHCASNVWADLSWRSHLVSYSYKLSSKHDCISEKQEKTLECSDSFTSERWVSVFMLPWSQFFDNTNCDWCNLNINNTKYGWTSRNLKILGSDFNPV